MKNKMEALAKLEIKIESRESELLNIENELNIKR